ncbi:LacI family DNA-binding transcriptional regulator [Geminisphaera colitermitum]|uniref:LacI family DNA-binding transcriptional regulator n=1 Tax=Geminisphaera colitermitum TaxID=1148786 RepID=UPI000158C6B5|nr:LacI family DNA-binding transcriptional regulator [Geminisphaera colitermitum]
MKTAQNSLPRVTHKDIARKMGVHRTTVSMALRGHPGIPPETRERVEKLAAEMGYAPDPMLSALSAYRSSRRPAAFQGTLAWIVNSSGNHSLRQWKSYRDGAEASARRHGFSMETLDMNTPDMTPARLAKMLRARSISGLLLCPQPRARITLDFPWEDFSAVTFGYTLAQPCLHTVVPAQYRNLTRIMRELLRRGYRRIGLALHDKHNARTDHNYLGAWYAESHFLASRIEPLLFDTWPDYRKQLEVWLRKWRPDAIISGAPQIMTHLDNIGMAVPEDVAVACTTLGFFEGNDDSAIAGINEESGYVGEVAADFLVAMMQRGERGIPGNPQRIHVEGTWFEGKTVRPLS